LRFAVQDLAITTDKQVVRRIQTDISLWKNGLIDPTGAAKPRTRTRRSGAHLRSYVATLSAYQAVDFDDLIRLPVEFRNNEKVRDKWQRRLRYLLMDEYQDTNTCQYELVKLMVTGIGKKPMFTAVGDDDQAIYAWRGASVENLKTLQTDFPIAVIKLEQNYRSTTRILQAANAVIGNNPKLFEKSLWSEHGLGEPIKVLGMPTDEQEAEQVAIMISADHFERKNKWSDYAILYRGNHQARMIEHACARSASRTRFPAARASTRRRSRTSSATCACWPIGRRSGLHPRRDHAAPRRGPVDAGSAGFSGQWQCSLFEAVFKGGIEAC
jgi:ATP-dependent DNA helicase Rep